MAKKKYFYNPETCSYEPVKTTQSDVLMGALGFIAISAVFAVIITLFYNAYFDTETEAKIRKDNTELEYHLTELKSGLEEIDQLMTFLKQRDANIYKFIYESEPSENQEISSSLSDEVFESLYKEGLKDQSAIKDFTREIDRFIKNSQTDNSKLKEVASIAFDQVDALKYIPTILPLENSEAIRLASGFGKRMNPFHHGLMEHEGVDFAAPRGTPVLATAQGTVKEVKITDAKTGYGNRIDIDHGNGIISRFAHLGEIKFKKGDKIEKGSIIGTVGKSGGTIAPSLHYEIIRNGVKVNPVNYFIQGITESEYMRILELAFRENQSLD